MSTQEINSQQKSNASAAAKSGSPKAKSLQSHLRPMLLECPSRQAFFEKVLAVSMQQLGASVGRIDYVMGDSRDSQLQRIPEVEQKLAERFSTEYMEPMTESVFASSSTDAVMKRYQRGNQTMTLLTSPILSLADDKLDAVVTLMMGGEHKGENILPRIDGVAAVASAVLVSKTLTAQKQSRDQNVSPVRSPHVGSSTPQIAQAIAQAGTIGSSLGNSPNAAAAEQIQTTGAIAKASQFKSTKEFGYSIVNSLASQLAAEQVSFGVERGQRIIVEAISNVADFKANSPGVQIVRQAMEECVDHESFVLTQNEQLEGDFASLPIHQQWASESNNASILSVPLKQGDVITGVVSIRRAMDRPFKQEEVAGLMQMLTPYGAALPVVERANRSVGAQLKAAASTTARDTVSRGSIGRKVLMVGLLLGALWFVFGTMTYRPICRTRVTAAEMRHFSAPMDAQLKLVNVEPGQDVKQGDMLVQFDTADLELGLNSLVREIASAQVELREAMVEEQLAAAALSRSRIKVLQAQATTIQKQIQDSTIVAPFDGTVVVADLQQRIGQNFPQGEEILQIAAEGDWLLEIEIPDDIANYVTANQEGVFSAAAAPAEKLPFKLKYVDGAAMTMEDRNVFMAKAPMESRPEWMMSGMEGTARIETVSRPVWWVTMHRAVDWARMNFWF